MEKHDFHYRGESIPQTFPATLFHHDSSVGTQFIGFEPKTTQKSTKFLFATLVEGVRPAGSYGKI